MAEWLPPLDWVTGQRLRARNLNRELNSNMNWLKDRPISVVTIPVQAADLVVSGTEWTVLPAAHQLELVLPDVSNVLLSASFTGLGSTDHQLWMDWVRDGDYWLSSSNGAKPSAADDGLSELYCDATQEMNITTMWWDVNVPAGRHTWDLAFVNASGSFSINQSNMAWQLWAMCW